MLWRKKNAYIELVEIVKRMPFINSTGTRYYPHPHSQKRYPYDTSALFEKELFSISKEESLLINGENSEEYIDERKTMLVSNWVQRNCPWNDEHGKLSGSIQESKRRTCLL